jgi:hypothetical protein
MTQITTQQSIQIQAAKNKVTIFRRIHYRPQASNKLAQVLSRVVSLEPKPLVKRVVCCAKSIRPFHHKSQPMPPGYSTQKAFYADKPVASMMQLAFSKSLETAY